MEDFARSVTPGHFETFILTWCGKTFPPGITRMIERVNGKKTNVWRYSYPTTFVYMQHRLELGYKLRNLKIIIKHLTCYIYYIELNQEKRKVQYNMKQALSRNGLELIQEITGFDNHIYMIYHQFTCYFFFIIPSTTTGTQTFIPNQPFLFSIYGYVYFVVFFFYLICFFYIVLFRLHTK